MLRKLMKYELRATGRVILPLFLLVILTAVGANLSTRTLLETSNEFLNLLGSLVLTAFVSAITGACIVSFAMMIYRFYKNLLQDEGYVMMTLPVSVHQHVWSKLLVSMLWFVASALVICVALGILTYDVEGTPHFFLSLRDLLDSVWDSGYAGHALAIMLELIVLLFFSCTAGCLQFYAAMAIGQSLSSHKLVCSVAVFFGIQFVLNLAGGSLIALMDATDLDYVLTRMMGGLSGIAVTHVVMAVMILAVVALSALFYFVTTHFLQKRLNLE